MEGDIDAFKHFFDTYYRELCNFINLYVKNELVAEELAQDIFVHFWERKNVIQIKSSVKSYLYAACKYKGLNYIRDRKRHTNIISDLSTETTSEISYDDFNDTQLKDILDRAIKSLPEKCKQVFLMRKELNLSNMDIASRLDISVKTVENHMTIAYKKLRQFLQPYKEQLFILFFFSIIR